MGQLVHLNYFKHVALTSHLKKPLEQMVLHITSPQVQQTWDPLLVWLRQECVSCGQCARPHPP